MLQKFTLVISLLVTCSLQAQVPIPAAPVVTNKPPKQMFLMWNPQPEAEKYYILFGPTRNNYTNSYFTTTNFIPIDPDLHYGIASMVNGELSGLAYWKSNVVWQGAVLTRRVNGSTNWIYVMDVATTNQQEELRLEAKITYN